MKSENLLQVEDLTIGFSQQGKINTVVDHISFTMQQGEILGIVGESGSGKSMTSLAIMDLLPKTALIMEGKIHFMDMELISASKEDKRKLKGSRMAMIFQEPMTSLNPVMTVGAQVQEMLQLHEKCSRREYQQRTLAALQEAGLENTEVLIHKYPHQLSGGMRQRTMIAMAMIAGPKLLIADEPTTALDITIQDKILKMLKKINQSHGTGMILVSHDLGVIKSICDRCLVLKSGIVVESGYADRIFNQPEHAYTKELVAAAPVDWTQQKEFMNHTKVTKKEKASDVSAGEAILTVKELSVFYREGTRSDFQRKERKQVVKKASLTLRRGETLGLVGESGCGKTTLAKAIAGLIKDREGVVTLTSQTPFPVQMVFQDPYGSLNPVRKVGWILEEPLRIQEGFSKEERRNKVLEMLRQVGLEEEHLTRYLSQLSGGQRQRVAIAAACILKPEIIILDEPVSSLDVTVQAQILQLLKQVQQKYKLSYLLISHDLNVIYQVCDRVCVMKQGEIVETGDTRDLIQKIT